MKLLKVRLDQFGLKISDKKTHETNLSGPSEKGNSGLRRRHAQFLGLKIFKTKVKRGKGSKLVFKTDSSKLSRSLSNLKTGLKRLMHAPVEMQARYLNSVIRGHCNYYGLAGNSKSLNCFHYYAIRLWRRTLSQRSQNGNITWDRMNRLLEKHKIAKPRLKVPYPKLPAYVIV